MKIGLFLLFFSLPVWGQEAYFTLSPDCENAIIKRLEIARTVDIAVYKYSRRFEELRERYSVPLPASHLSRQGETSRISPPPWGGWAAKYRTQAGFPPLNLSYSLRTAELKTTIPTFSRILAESIPIGIASEHRRNPGEKFSCFFLKFYSFRKIPLESIEAMALRHIKSLFLYIRLTPRKQIYENFFRGFPRPPEPIPIALPSSIFSRPVERLNQSRFKNGGKDMDDKDTIMKALARLEAMVRNLSKQLKKSDSSNDNQGPEDLDFAAGE